MEGVWNISNFMDPKQYKNCHFLDPIPKYAFNPPPQYEKWKFGDHQYKINFKHPHIKVAYWRPLIQKLTFLRAPYTSFAMKNYVFLLMKILIKRDFVCLTLFFYQKICLFRNSTLELQSIASFCHAKSSNFFTVNDVGFCLLADPFFQIVRIRSINILFIFFAKKRNVITFFYRNNYVFGNVSLKLK